MYKLLVKEFSLVIFNFAKNAVPENLAFLFDVELFESEFHEDILSLMDVLRAAIALNPQNIIFDKGISLVGIGDSLRTIVETLLNTNLIYKNADNVVIGVLGLLDIVVTAEDLANVANYNAFVKCSYDEFPRVYLNGVEICNW